jgi:hydroxymethylpyrimidine/phosphomethylpyrimidine kinase
LLEIACVVTPNIPEAEILAAMPIKTPDDMKRAAEKIAARASSNTSLSVLVKGGHRTADSDAGDLLFTHGRFVELPGERINTKNTHGTGCTLSSAIASRLALGDNVEDAVRFAKAYITQAIKDNLGLGKGCGPVGHLVALYRQAGIQPAAGL